MANSQLVKKSNDGSRPGYKGGILEWAATNWKDLAKAGAGAVKYYLDYKDQKKRNEMEQAAYNEYMKQVEAAGQEAQAAIDLNLMPMEVTNIPQTKADVTDFTAVAARGGLMNLPTRQRKRYAYGPGIEDIEVMDEEVISPYDLQMEEGVNIGEQVFHDTGDDRTNAQNVWQSGAIDQEIYQLDFEIFFKSGDWQDHISRGTVQGDTQMASSELRISPQIIAEWEADGGANGPYKTPQEYYEAYYGQMAGGGIAGLRHGGRPGYQFGIGPQQGMMPQGMMPQGMMPQGMMPQGMMPPQGLRPGYREGEGPIEKWGHGSPDIMAKSATDIEVEDAYGVSVDDGGIVRQINRLAAESDHPDIFPSTDSDFQALEILSEEIDVDLERLLRIAKESNWSARYANQLAQGGRARYAQSDWIVKKSDVEEEQLPRMGREAGAAEKILENQPLEELDILTKVIVTAPDGTDVPISQEDWDKVINGEITKKEALENAGWISSYEKIEFGNAKGGLPKRVRKAPGGIMDLGGLEKDYRTTGGFVPIGGRERADDVPARLSKNEFVMTADAVRAAGGGSINRGAQRMYDTMKHLEASPGSKRMTA